MTFRRTDRWLILLALPLMTSITEAVDRPLVFGVNRVGGEFAVFSAPEYGESMYQRIREAGGTFVRLAASPRDIERVPGQRNWDNLDRDVELALEYGQEVMFCIVNTPAWASPTGEDTHQYAYRPELFPQFVDFCRDLASRYLGRVRYFQLWNEQNGCSWHFHDGWNHADEYIPFLAACRDGIKQGNPEAILLMGGLDDAEGHAQIFLKRSYDELQYNFDNRLLWDGLTDHPYSWTTEEMKRKLDVLRGIQNGHGHGHLPLFITEYGWRTGHVSLEQQAQHVADFLAAFASPDWDFLQGAIYLSLADFEQGPDGFGICDANLRPRPAFYAFQGAVRFGASPPHRILWRPLSPSRVEITWNTLLPAGSALTLTSADGTVAAEHLASSWNTDFRATLDGLAPGAVYDGRIVTWTQAGKSAASATFPVRLPGRELYNAGFEQGFVGGIAKGWTITGEGFCADARYAPDAKPAAGEHAQVIWARGAQKEEDRMAIDSTLQAYLATAAGEQLQLRVQACGLPRDSTSTGLQARVGIDPDGGSDPGAAAVVWSDWNTLQRRYGTLSASAAARGDLSSVFIQCRTTASFAAGKPMIVVDDVSVSRTP